MVKIYFAGAENRQELLKKVGIKNILVSFYNRPNLEKYKDFNVFLDSGAFTAYNSGKVIDIDEYIDFIKKHKPSLYANLDVIGNAEETFKNQKYMESKGLKPIPVFHFNEDFKYLNEYAKKYDYIALGGVAQLKVKSKIHSWLKKCFKIIPSTTKTHGFAVTSPELLKIYPFYSVDSTSWLSGGKFGMIFTSFNKFKFKEINKKVKKGTKDYLNVDYYNLIQWKKFADSLEEEKI